MCKFLTVSFLYALTCFHLGAQILPKENSKLNYRLIGFSFPAKQGEAKYKIEIAEGNHTSEILFEQNRIKSLPVNTNKIITEVPSFGKEYTWRVTRAGKTEGGLHHFSTAFIPQVDTNVSRVRVIKKAERYKDACIMADGTGVLYDMDGKPLWFLPDVAGALPQSIDLLDLKLSSSGTLTYIHASEVYEADYNGKILWKGPDDGKVSGGKTEEYHHEFTRLDNGHYMALGREYVVWKMPGGGPIATTAVGVTRDSGDLRQNLAFSTLIEYDQQGNVVWSWKSSDYAKKCDLYNYNTKNWRYNINDIHENAFFFDQKEGVIYLSCKNISRIIKIKYPEGNVLNTYGQTYEQDNIDGKGKILFCDQHSCRRSAEGYLYLYNNNDCTANHPPELMIFKEPVSAGDTLQKIWGFDCTLDGVPETDTRMIAFTGGGNILELPGGEIFANMDSKRYSKSFIVGRDKEVLWSALFEQLDPRSNRWKAIPNYRVSIIANRKVLEDLVWNQESGNLHSNAASLRPAP